MRLFISSIIFLTSFLLSLRSFCQVNEYSFLHENFGYIPQSNDSETIALAAAGRRQGAIYVNTSSSTDLDFNTGPGYPIGFEFLFDGKHFDHFAVSDNGYVKLGQGGNEFTIKKDSAVGAVFGPGFPAERKNTISVFQTQTTVNRRNSATIEYAAAKGFPGERKTNVTWAYSFRAFDFDEYNQTHNMDVQVVFHESSGKITMSYRSFSFVPFPSHITNVAVGLRGSQLNNDPSNLHLRSVVDGENNWATSYKSTRPDSLMDFSRDLIAINRSGDPGSRTFSFTPPGDSSAQPACPTTYFLVPDHYPGAIYGDNTDHYILAHNADSVSLNPRLGWSPASLLENTYDLYLSTDDPPTEPLVTGITGTRWQLPELAPGTTYYMGIVAHNTNGSTPLCITAFTTSRDLDYCNISSPGGNGVIESLEFNTLHFQSSPEVDNIVVFPAVQPYTTTLSRGETYTLRYTQAAIPGQRVNIIAFIDFNQNGLLSETNNDADEEVFFLGALGPSTGTEETQIAIPSDASLGNTRMRIRLVRTTFAGNLWDPCAFTNGITQDYTITIGPSAACAGLTMSPNVQSLSCFNAGDGSIDLQLSGGTEPYAVQWEKNGQSYAGNSSSIGSLERATYQAFVEDAAGCDIQTPLIAITQPAGLELAESSVSEPLCANGETGRVAVTIEGGTGPYTYLWSNGQTDSIAESLGQGAYSVTITDDRGCELKPAPFLVEAPGALAISNETVISESCAGTADGQINLTVEGGTGPYAFLWSNGQTSANATGLVNGQYSVTITDENGCKLASQPFTIGSLQPLTLSRQEIVNESCSEADDGQILLEVSGGTAPYNFLWNDGQITPTAVALDTGEYSATITDSKGCQLITGPFIITGSNPLMASVQFNHEAQSTDLVVLTSGGTPPYSYTWSNGHLNAEFENAPPGEYTMTVNDAKGCSYTLEGIEVRPQVTTSLDPGLGTGISFYPNPARQKVFLKVSRTIQDRELSIVSLEGRIRWQQTITTNSKNKELVIDVSAIPPGQYYLVIQGDDRLYTEKLAIH